MWHLLFSNWLPGDWKVFFLLYLNLPEGSSMTSFLWWQFHHRPLSRFRGWVSCQRALRQADGEDWGSDHRTAGWRTTALPPQPQPHHSYTLSSWHCRLLKSSASQWYDIPLTWPMTFSIGSRYRETKMGPGIEPLSVWEPLRAAPDLPISDKAARTEAWCFSSWAMMLRKGMLAGEANWL